MSFRCTPVMMLIRLVLTPTAPFDQLGAGYLNHHTLDDLHEITEPDRTPQAEGHERPDESGQVLQNQLTHEGIPCDGKISHHLREYSPGGPKSSSDPPGTRSGPGAAPGRRPLISGAGRPERASQSDFRSASR